MKKKTIKAWAIYFLGNRKERAGICWWDNYATGQFYETKKDAQRAFERKVTDDKHLFEILPCEISYTIPLKKKK